MKIVNFKTEKIVFLLLVFLFVIERFVVLSNFNWHFTDDDQSLMCLAAQEFAHGRFHQPLFFGQNYNSHLESLLTVPFIWLHIDPFKAAPLVSLILSIIPILFLSIISIRKYNNYLVPILIITFYILLPTQYSMLTMMPRGFVTGISMVFAGVILFYMLNYSATAFGLLTFFILLSYLIGPNSLLFSSILLVPFLKKIKFNNHYIISILLAVLTIICFLILINHFYKVNPEAIVHPAWKLEFGFNYLKNNLLNFSKLFYYLGPFHYKLGYLSLIIIFIFGFTALIKKNYEIFLISLIALLTIFISLFLNKVNDGVDDIYFPYSRFFLSIPPIISFLFFIQFKNVRLTNKFLPITVLIICSVFSFYKINRINETIDFETTKMTYLIDVEKVDVLEGISKKLMDLSKEYGANLLIIDSKKPIFTYAIPVLSKSKLRTITHMYERRYWRIIEEKKSSDKNVLLYSTNPEIYSKLINSGLKMKRTKMELPFYIIEDNKINNYALTQLIGSIN